MEHVLDIYKLPYDEDYPVVCMDESPKQLIEEVASTPMKQGQEARLDYEYIRHGMVNIFIANEPLKGTRLVEITGFKTKKDWARFVKRIADEMYPRAKKIRLVMESSRRRLAPPSSHTTGHTLVPRRFLLVVKLVVIQCQTKQS